MQITLVQGLLIALLVFICAIDKHMETFMWFRPLVVAFFTGIILGDVRLGMQAGAVAELSYLGLLTVGGTVPPDPLFAGLMTTVLGVHHRLRCQHGTGSCRSVRTDRSVDQHRHQHLLRRLPAEG